MDLNKANCMTINDSDLVGEKPLKNEKANVVNNN
jgi:hypothetical protein